MRASKIRKFRPWVQAMAFILFIVLLLAAGRIAFLPADLFFRLDPLVGLAGMLAARRFTLTMFIGGLIVLVLTLIFGEGLVWLALPPGNCA